MAMLRIPSQFETGLNKIRELKEESLQKLIEVLNHCTSGSSYTEVVTFVKNEGIDVPESDLHHILRMLISLGQTRARVDVESKEIAGLVCDAMSESENELLRLAGEECDIFKDRLTRLLEIECLEYLAKVRGVVSDHDHVFIRARTLTDIRAVFGKDTEVLPHGAAIIHTLNIAYQKGNKSKNFHVAMDERDIHSLIKTLQRALSKTKGLNALIEAAGVSRVDTE